MIVDFSFIPSVYPSPRASFLKDGIPENFSACLFLSTNNTSSYFPWHLSSFHRR